MAGTDLSSIKNLFSQYAILDVNFPVAEKYKILGIPQLSEPPLDRHDALDKAKKVLDSIYDYNDYRIISYLWNTSDSHYADYLNSIGLDSPSIVASDWTYDMTKEQSLSALAITFKYTSADAERKPIPDKNYYINQVNHPPRQYTGPVTILPPDSPKRSNLTYQRPVSEKRSNVIYQPSYIPTGDWRKDIPGFAALPHGIIVPNQYRILYKPDDKWGAKLDTRNKVVKASKYIVGRFVEINDSLVDYLYNTPDSHFKHNAELLNLQFPSNPFGYTEWLDELLENDDTLNLAALLMKYSTANPRPNRLKLGFLWD